MITTQAEFAELYNTAAADSIAAKLSRPHHTIAELKDFSLNDFLVDVSQRLVNFAINLAIAILVFYVGKFIIKRIYRFVGSILVKRNVDQSLTTFVLSFIKIVLYFILMITVIGILGIETSSFLALFASAGIAIGMALSGTLQNFAGGVLILLLKPYRIGDYIEAQGYAGTVREIQIFHTIISTYDNKAIIVPNGGLSTSSINNWSREEYRRVSWDISISYGDSVKDAEDAILAMFAEDPDIVHHTPSDLDDLDNPQPETAPLSQIEKPGFWKRLFGKRSKVKEALDRWEESNEAQIRALKPQAAKAPSVVVSNMADSSVVISARVWVPTAKYWEVYYKYNRRFYEELPLHNIHFPFPQMDVHMKSE